MIIQINNEVHMRNIPDCICVYKINNRKNNMSFIGYTTNLQDTIVSFKERLTTKNSIRDFNDDLYKDVVQCGINSFEFIVLEKFDRTINIEHLKDCTVEYILGFHTHNSYIGYNKEPNYNNRKLKTNAEIIKMVNNKIKVIKEYRNLEQSRQSRIEMIKIKETKVNHNNVTFNYKRK